MPVRAELQLVKLPHLEGESGIFSQLFNAIDTSSFMCSFCQNYLTL